MYGIQGTGNGHISRSIVLLKELYTYFQPHQIDILISGTSYTLAIPFPVTYQFSGVSFVYGNKGKISYSKSIKEIDIKRIQDDMNKVPFKNYHIIITDQEPITAWGAKKHNIPSIGVGNIYGVEHSGMKRLFLHRLFSKAFQRFYCPVKKKIPFHFSTTHSSQFFPIIDNQLKQERIKNNHFTLVYLLSYSAQELIQVFCSRPLQHNRFVIYTRHVSQTISYKNVFIKPLSKKSFLKDLAHCEHIICTAGFQTISEALYAKKHILLIPIKGQPEQRTNAIMLKKHHVSSIRKLQAHKILKWIHQQQKTSLQVKDGLQDIVNAILYEINEISKFNN